MRLIHASRAPRFTEERRTAEEHVGTCPELRDNPPKGGLIPDAPGLPGKDFSVREGPAAYQLVGKVKAYQGYDG